MLREQKIRPDRRSLIRYRPVPVKMEAMALYVVEEGDTLAIISRKMYGDVNHVDAICRMNGITDGNLIYVGQKLLLP